MVFKLKCSFLKNNYTTFVRTSKVSTYIVPEKFSNNITVFKYHLRSWSNVELHMRRAKLQFESNQTGNAWPLDQTSNLIRI